MKTLIAVTILTLLSTQAIAWVGQSGSSLYPNNNNNSVWGGTQYNTNQNDSWQVLDNQYRQEQAQRRTNYQLQNINQQLEQMNYNQSNRFGH